MWNSNNYKEQVHSKLAPSCKIIGTNDSFLNNEARKDKKGPLYPEEHQKEFLDNYYKNVVNILGEFGGVATKYLKEYLHWISLFFEDNKEHSADFLRENYIQFYNIKFSKLGF